VALETRLKTVLILVRVLLSVAFTTLLERKRLSLIQTRKGPNKVGASGLLQPFSDALKLFRKELFTPRKAQASLFNFSPIVLLFLSLLVWLTYPCIRGGLNISLPLLFVLGCIAVRVYPLLGAG